MNYQLIIFDIDGTLVDSGDVWAPAVQRAVREVCEEEKLGLPVPSLDQIRPIIGMTGSQALSVFVPEKYSHLYPELSRRIGIYGHEAMKSGVGFLFDGVIDTFKKLKDNGAWIALASNCGNSYLHEVQDKLGIREYVDLPLCLDTPKVACKADMLALALDTFQTRRALMVGDRRLDLEAAHVNGIPFVGFSAGFGSHEEWPEADAVVHHYSEFLPVLSKRKDLLLNFAKPLAKVAAKRSIGVTGLPSSGKTQFAEELATVFRELRTPLRLITLEEFRLPAAQPGKEISESYNLKELLKEIQPSREREVVILEGHSLWDREISRRLDSLISLEVSEETALRRFMGKVRNANDAKLSKQFQEKFQSGKKHWDEFASEGGSNPLRIDNNNILQPSVKA